MEVAKLDKRVNLRIDTETYDAYEKVASFFNRSVADFMREALSASLEWMHGLGAMIDQAKAGDAEAVQRLFDAMIAVSQGKLDLVREIDLAEQGSAAKALADSNSDTVR